jgi:hypothetical protein
MARYTFYKQGNNVICVSHYAGKTVKGIARCAPDDVYDENFGKSLAQLRCDIKVAEKRYKAAVDNAEALNDLYNWVKRDKEDAEDWLLTCQVEVANLTDTYDRIIKDA